MIWKGSAIIPILLAKQAFIENDDIRTIIRGKTMIGPLSVKDASLMYSTDPFDKNQMEYNSHLKPKNVYDELRDYDLDGLSLYDSIGPAIPEDEAESTTNTAMPVSPSSLENEIVIDLPVGFLRLRRALLSNTSSFWIKSILQGTLKYTEVNSTGWVHPYEHCIGHVDVPSHVRNELFIGAKRNTSYRMPASRFVPANMAYETCTLTDYTYDYFVLSMTTSTPGVPFGKMFLAKTQIVLVRTGTNRCRMICSVETHFPKGAPLGMKGQIRKGMKSGTMEIFEKIGSFIHKCANLEERV